MSGGEACPLRSEMARSICSETRNAGIQLEPVKNTTSEAVCAAVNRGDLDLGLVLGGFPKNVNPNVRQVATFGVEPLHLLVRPELAQGRGMSLDALRGRVVSLGEQGSNGAILAESLMRFAGMAPTTADKQGDYRAAHLKDRELYAALRTVASASPDSRAAFASVLPDAVFLVENMPAPLVDKLVSVGRYQFMPLPYATALHLDSRRNHSGWGEQLDSSRLERVTIPACAYGINPPSPPTDCETFGLRLLLVANKNVPSTDVYRLLRVLDGDATKKFRIELEVAEQFEEFPIHPGAKAFANGRKPIVLGEIVEPIGNVLSVGGAAGAGLLAIWGFVRGLRAVHPDVHLRQIDRIERLLRGDEQDESAPLLPGDFVEYLEERLVAIKQAAIEDYATKRLQGDEAFISILTMISDTRHLIAQRRELLLGEYDDRQPPRKLSNAA
jgi:TRAP-type uncharacterized transport system substrate-binding protein